MTTFLPPHIRLKELATLRCALGLRFRDTATNEIVRSGLRVTAMPVVPGKRQPSTGRAIAQVNPSGVWCFHRLPGLRRFELGVEDLPETGSSVTPPSFRLEVLDEEGRFHPCSVQATASSHGPFEFTPPLSPPPWPWRDVPLFPAPERAVPPGCAVIRMNLATSAVGAPARWTLARASTTVRNRNIDAWGVANESGDLVLMFPWPELAGVPTVLSPPGGTRMEAQGWEYSFECWHNLAENEASIADLDEILNRPARAPDVLRMQTSPPTPFTRATLRYGRELVVPESVPASPTGPFSFPRTLIITPAGSPL